MLITIMNITGKKEPPSAEEIAEKFLKRWEFITDDTNTSLLFMFFAQHFTHEFFKTEYGNPGFTWGRHGVDVSHIYGQGVERESQLRTFQDGKLKSQKKKKKKVQGSCSKAFQKLLTLLIIY